MDGVKRSLKGSEKRDEFKRRHKELPGWFYATDADLCLISKHPPGTVAYLDYKGIYDSVTFAEVIQYNRWMTDAPVYLVIGDDPENGPFEIQRYLGGEWRPEPPVVRTERVTHCEDWGQFEAWERELRQEYTRRGGWSGHLKRKPVPEPLDGDGRGAR